MQVNRGFQPRIKALSALFLVISKRGAEKYFSQTLPVDLVMPGVFQNISPKTILTRLPENPPQCLTLFLIDCGDGENSTWIAWVNSNTAKIPMKHRANVHVIIVRNNPRLL